MRPNFRMTFFIYSHQPYKISRPVQALPQTWASEAAYVPLTSPLFGPCASPLLIEGHRQVISGISKGSQNILIYNFIITTFDCQSGNNKVIYKYILTARAEVFLLGHLPWHALHGVAPPLN